MRTCRSGGARGDMPALRGRWTRWSVSWWGEALTAWLGFAGFCAQEMGLEAEKLLEALSRPFAERVRDLEELSVRHEVEADVEGVEEYLVLMTEAWRRQLESA